MLELSEFKKRSCYCAQVIEKKHGNEIVLYGWVSKRRDHGGLIFIDLRDRTGIVQVVFSSEISLDAFRKAEHIRNEYVLYVKGKVQLRNENKINENIPTGKVEIIGKKLEILNTAKTPPFYIQDNIECDEQLRLKYRYLDLRRPQMQHNFRIRHKVTIAIRKFLDEKDFFEIETPILCKSTPEGARDYLVPSRVHNGKFFALPQSPQLFKQLFMVAGMDKYYQIARCFRDEDLRADRQPEFTQLDMEMSFVNREQVMKITENLITYIFKEILHIDIPLPIPRINYTEAINVYGTDKPDLRFEMPLINISYCIHGSKFKVYNQIIEAGGVVKCINVKDYANVSRKELDGLVTYVQSYGVKGMTWICYINYEMKSPISKFFNEKIIKEIFKVAKVELNDLLLIIAGDLNTVNTALGALRIKIARRRKLIKKEDEFKFAWIINFPLFEYNAENKKIIAVHHPFTSPNEEDLKYIETNPLQVRANAYDLVLNGTELGGGSIRVFQRDLQSKIFNIIGINTKEANEKFGFLLDAFEYGAPPHGGIALGLDRLIMLMAKCLNIRDVIAFPKTQSAQDLMMNCPSKLNDKQLKEVNIKI